MIWATALLSPEIPCCQPWSWTVVSYAQQLNDGGICRTSPSISVATQGDCISQHLQSPFARHVPQTRLVRTWLKTYLCHVEPNGSLRKMVLQQRRRKPVAVLAIGSDGHVYIW